MHWSWELAKLVPIIVYVLLRTIYFAVINLKWNIFGNVLPPAGKSARMCRILYRRKVISVDMASPKDFLTYHERWEDPAVVLLSNVTLYSISKTEATFVECPKDVDLKEAHSFYYSAQYENAVRVITIPIEDFHTIADSLGVPEKDQKIVHLYSVGRCGSTLLQKMMSAIPKSISLSEPDSFTVLCGLKDKISEAEFQRMLVSISRMETKVLKDTHAQVDTVVLKFRSQCNSQGPDVFEHLPHIKQLFMYRDATKVVQSVVRTFGDLPFINLLLNDKAPEGIKSVIKKQILNMTKNNSHKKGHESRKDVFPDDFLQTLPVTGILATSWVNECLTYLDLRKQKVPIVGVRYEDLVEQPADFFKLLLENVEIPGSARLVQEAVRQTKQDSQANSSISKSSQSAVTFTDQDLQAVADVVKRHPLFQSTDAVLEGTLLH